MYQINTFIISYCVERIYNKFQGLGLAAGKSAPSTLCATTDEIRTTRRLHHRKAEHVDAKLAGEELEPVLNPLLVTIGLSIVIQTGIWPVSEISWVAAIPPHFESSAPATFRQKSGRLVEFLIRDAGPRTQDSFRRPYVQRNGGSGCIRT